MKSILRFSAALLASSFIGLSGAQTAAPAPTLPNTAAPMSAPMTTPMTAPMTAPKMQTPMAPAASTHTKKARVSLRYLDAAGKVVRSPASKKANPADPAVSVQISRAGQLLATYPIVPASAAGAQATTKKHQRTPVMVNVNGQPEGLSQAIKALGN